MKKILLASLLIFTLAGCKNKNSGYDYSKYKEIKIDGDYVINETFEQANKSELIMVGKFTGSSSQKVVKQYNPNYGKDVFVYGVTTLEVEVVETLKGNINNKKIKINLPYCVLEDENSFVQLGSINPLSKNDEYIFCLNKTTTDAYYINGEFSGLYPVFDSTKVEAFKNEEKKIEDIIKDKDVMNIDEMIDTKTYTMFNDNWYELQEDEAIEYYNVISSINEIFNDDNEKMFERLGINLNIYSQMIDEYYKK